MRSFNKQTGRQLVYFVDTILDLDPSPTSHRLFWLRIYMFDTSRDPLKYKYRMAEVYTVSYSELYEEGRGEYQTPTLPPVNSFNWIALI